MAIDLLGRRERTERMDVLDLPDLRDHAAETLDLVQLAAWAVVLCCAVMAGVTLGRGLSRG